jgi:hypothetical protein
MSHPHSSLLLQFFSEKPQSCIAKSPKDTVFGGSLFTLMSLGSLAETYGDGNSPWLKKTGRKIMYHLGNGVLFGQLTILIWWLGSLSYFQLGCEEVFFPAPAQAFALCITSNCVWRSMRSQSAVNGSQYLGKLIRQWYRHTCTIMQILYIPRLFVIGLIQHQLGVSINRDTVIPQNGWIIVYSGKT